MGATSEPTALGGVTIQQVPYRLVALVAAVGGPLAGASWFAR
ncbi:hypothetical protein AB0I94_27860 [Streptomyces sp. NPDC050147]